MKKSKCLMLIPFNDKLALNRNGHLVFSSGLAIVTWYIIKDYLNISIPFLLLHLPIYLIGSLFPDWIEPGGRSLISHRSFFHGKRFFWIITIILLPIFIYLSIITKMKLIFDIPYNYYSILSAFLLGVLTHLLGDALTSKLKR